MVKPKLGVPGKTECERKPEGNVRMTERVGDEIRGVCRGGRAVMGRQVAVGLGYFMLSTVSGALPESSFSFLTCGVQETFKVWRSCLGRRSGSVKQKWRTSDFPGDPVVKTQCFHCWGQGLTPWLGKLYVQYGGAKK